MSSWTNFGILYTHKSAHIDMDRKVYINRIASFLPNSPISNDEMEEYIGLIGGKISNIVILPNGEVTICEQLYWNKNFLIGNVCESSIKEIWNSAKAIGLWKREQTSINPHSPCRNCSDFSACFQASNRCYANIMKAYGITNFDYPDPRCIQAPNFTYSITHEDE